MFLQHFKVVRLPAPTPRPDALLSRCPPGTWRWHPLPHPPGSARPRGWQSGSRLSARTQPSVWRRPSGDTCAVCKLHAKMSVLRAARIFLKRILFFLTLWGLYSCLLALKKQNHSTTCKNIHSLLNSVYNECLYSYEAMMLFIYNISNWDLPEVFVKRPPVWCSGNSWIFQQIPQLRPLPNTI